MILCVRITIPEAQVILPFRNQKEVMNMKKGLLAISLVLLLSIAIAAPNCTGPGTTGTIFVKATIDGLPWTGPVTYNLTPASGSPVTGTSVDKTFTEAAGTWTCSYISGGPGTFVSITPSASQALAAGQNITFTLNFQTPLDATIVFKGWTINGATVAGGQSYTLYPGDWVDVEYTEHMYGPPGNVTVHQTSWLKVHNIGMEGEQGGPDIILHVDNEAGAVSMDPPSTPMNQQCTLDGAPVQVCMEIPLHFCEPVILDVEVDWNLQICTDYTKTINWFSFPSPPPVLFHILPGLPPSPIGVSMNLTTWASVNLPGDTNQSNDTTPPSPWIVVTYQNPP